VQYVGEEILKHQNFNYELQLNPDKVRNVSVSLDGTTMNIKGDGYREAMVRAI
jgi:hypothetical protein